MASNNRASGALFRNTKKAEGSNQPDMNGNIEFSVEMLESMLVDAKIKAAGKQPLKMKLAGWTKVAASGLQYLSLSLQMDNYTGSTRTNNSSTIDDAPF